MNDTMAIQRIENHLIAEEKSAATIEKNRHHSRGRFCHTERQAAKPPEHLAGHEGIVQPKGGCVTVSGCPSSISGSSLPNWKRSERNSGRNLPRNGSGWKRNGWNRKR